MRRRRLSYYRHIQWLTLACGMPGLISALLLLWAGDFSTKVVVTVVVLSGGAWLGLALTLRGRIIRPLQTASNMLSAMREGDYSLQAGYADDEDPMGQLMQEINRINAVLKENKLGAIETLALFNKVVSEIDVAVFTFDSEMKLGIVNRAGAAIYQKETKALLGRRADELGLLECLGSRQEILVLQLPGMKIRGRQFAVRRGSFREDGKPHTLLLLTDVSASLREEERQAWKKLIRVLGHELNNSLTPIKSISQSLLQMSRQAGLDQETGEDLAEGLRIIHERAEGLGQFLSEYARLAKLPPPVLQATGLTAILRRVVSLQSSLYPVEWVESPDLVLPAADASHLEQAIINLLKNAVEAARQSQGRVQVGCQQEGSMAVVKIQDEGPGIANPDNLFVPFFSTKPGGSGIGLMLSRQIIEAHQGSLELRNREDVPHGAEAIIRLPL